MFARKRSRKRARGTLDSDMCDKQSNTSCIAEAVTTQTPNNSRPVSTVSETFTVMLENEIYASMYPQCIGADYETYNHEHDLDYDLVDNSCYASDVIITKL